MVVLPAFGAETNENFTSISVHGEVDLDELPLRLPFAVPHPDPLTVLVQRQPGGIDDHGHLASVHVTDGLLQQIAEIGKGDVPDVVLNGVRIRYYFKKPGFILADPEKKTLCVQVGQAEQLLEHQEDHDILRMGRRTTDCPRRTDHVRVRFRFHKLFHS